MKKKELKDFFLSLSSEEKKTFAKKCNTSVGYIQQIYNGFRSCSAELAIEIDKNSNGTVSCEQLSPTTDFNYLRNKFSGEVEKMKAHSVSYGLGLIPKVIKYDVNLTTKGVVSYDYNFTTND